MQTLYLKKCINGLICKDFRKAYILLHCIAEQSASYVQFF